MLKKTQEEKEISGTYEPSKEGLVPVEYDAYERIPTAPANWPPAAQKIWMDRCQDLKNAGYLIKAMMPALRRYCFAVYMAEVAERNIMDNDLGEMGFIGTTCGKWYGVLAEANKTIKDFGAKFGFTPYDGAKIPGRKPAKEGGEMSLLK